MLQPTKSSMGAMAGNINPGSATLMLFSPRRFVEHYKRPMTYNFNNEVTEAIYDKVIDNPTYNTGDAVIAGTPQANAAIIPATQGSILHTEIYSQCWTFVLIIDKPLEVFGNTVSGMSRRELLVGICGDEPISKAGIQSAANQGTHVNPNCNLIVTRRLKLNRRMSVGANGPIAHVSTVAAVDSCEYSTAVWNNSSNANAPEIEYRSMLPHDIVSTIGGNRDQPNIVLDKSDSLNVVQSEKLPIEMCSPRRCLSTIIDGISTGVDQTRYEDEFQYGEVPTSSSFDYDNRADVYIRKSIIEQSKNRCATYDEEVVDSAILTIGGVMATYHPNVIPIVTPPNTPGMVIPQRETSINNIFSSLVSASLPTFLTETGVSGVGFMYNSFSRATKVTYIDSVIPCTNQELRNKWNMLIGVIGRELFPVLYRNGGNFDISVMCILNGDTSVVLNFLDYTPLPDDAIYVDNTILGGIVSPLVGGSDQAKYNAIQLNGLISQIGYGADTKANVDTVRTY